MSRALEGHHLPLFGHQTVDGSLDDGGPWTHRVGVGRREKEGEKELSDDSVSFFFR